MAGAASQREGTSGSGHLLSGHGLLHRRLELAFLSHSLLSAVSISPLATLTVRAAVCAAHLGLWHFSCYAFDATSKYDFTQENYFPFLDKKNPY